MRIPRIYQPAALHSQMRLHLDATATNHLTRVLRLKPGAPLILFNGEGGQYQATLAAAGRREAEIEVGQFEAVECESPLAFTLVQGISRGERMDYTIQKAVELGVGRIVPILTERSVVNLDAKRRQKREQHWQGIIISACEQCGRNRLPRLEPITTLGEHLTQGPEGLGLLLDHRAEQGIAELTPGDTISLLIGPEGGLSETERQQALAAGYRGIRLGPRVLRTETAALAALAAMQSRWGDL